MRVVNVSIASTKAQAVKKKNEWKHRYSKITIARRESALNLRHQKGYNKYYYAITAWE
jgi:hypothetical protein